jgi:hypothetical protein
MRAPYFRELTLDAPVLAVQTSACVVNDDAERVAVSRAHHGDAMTHLHAILAADASYGPRVTATKHLRRILDTSLRGLAARCDDRFAAS